MALLVYAVKPSLAPTLSNPTPGSEMNVGVFFKAVLPIAVCFTLQIVLSNHAYLYADIAFLQMMKESNVVAVYGFCVAFGLEAFAWKKVGLVCCIVCSTWCTIQGELHFTMAAFLLQGTSFFAESLKITLQGLLLSSAGIKFDALSFLLIVMPSCAFLFGTFLTLCAWVVPANLMIMPIPGWADWTRMPGHLLLNALTAISLNIVGTLFLKYSSALSYVVAGILKDTLIVMTGIILMGHETTPLQFGGFVCQIFFISLWSFMKAFPGEIERRVRMLMGKGETLEDAKAM